MDFGYPESEEEAVALAREVGGDPEAALRMYRAAGFSDASRRLERVASILRGAGLVVGVMYMYREPRVGPGYDVYVSMVPFLTERGISLFRRMAGAEPVELGLTRSYRDSWRRLIGEKGRGVLLFHSSPPDRGYSSKVTEFSREVCPSCPVAFVSHREGWIGPPVAPELVNGMPVYPAGFWCDNSEVRYELMARGIRARALYPDELEIARGILRDLGGA